MSRRWFDTVVVGGGIVGLAAARELFARRPGLRLAVLEKGARLGAHQTSHNSGVIHSGVSYRPGSLKARTCVAGAKMMVEFCRARGIPHEICGKVIVATDASELPRLQTLHARGLANGVPGLSMIGPQRLRELEPHARGIQALHVAGTGVVDYSAVARALAAEIQQQSGAILMSTRVTRLVRRQGCWILQTTAGDVEASAVITCGGLQADRLSRSQDVRIVPFRGEYYDLVPARQFLVRHLIYPVPEPAFPFLGVHFTRSIAQTVHAGPNAVLALAREGYRKRDVSLRDLAETIAFRGFWNMARRYWATGLVECYRSWSRAAFARAAQRLVPEVRTADLVPAGSGVRAQAVDRRGMLLDDFHLVQAPGAVHVLNVPSPAATASLRIAQLIADLAAPILPPPRAAVLV